MTTPALPKETRDDWSRRVRERRIELGLTQIGLGNDAQTDQSTISRLERGDLDRIGDDLKWRLAGALACTVSDLFPWPAVRPPVPSKVA